MCRISKMAYGLFAAFIKSNFYRIFCQFTNITQKRNRFCNLFYFNKIFLKVQSKRMQLRREIIDLLGDNGILIFPPFPTPPPFHNQAIFTPFNFIYNAIWNALGLPVL